MAMRSTEPDLLALKPSTVIASWETWHQYIDQWFDERKQIKFDFMLARINRHAYEYKQQDLSELGTILFDKGLRLADMAKVSPEGPLAFQLLMLANLDHDQSEKARKCQAWNARFGKFNITPVSSQTLNLPSDANWRVDTHVCMSNPELIKLLRAAKLYVAGWQLSYVYGDLIVNRLPFGAAITYKDGTPVGVILFTFDNDVLVGSLACQLFVRKAERGQRLVAHMAKLLARSTMPEVSYITYGIGVDHSPLVFEKLKHYFKIAGLTTTWVQE